MIKYKRGQILAALVPIQGGPTYHWIVAQFVKKVGSNRVSVHDPDGVENESNNYTIDAHNVINFPRLESVYEAGEHILSLFHDPITNTWSTVFYEAIVLSVKDDATLNIQFKDTTLEMEVSVMQVSKVPPGCDIAEFQVETMQFPVNENVSPQEKRRFAYFSGKRNIADDHHITIVTDEELKGFAGAREPVRKVPRFGVPIVEFLKDDLLFDQIPPHVTSCGMMTRHDIQEDGHQSMLAVQNETCGRLSMIIKEWRIMS